MREFIAIALFTLMHSTLSGQFNYFELIEGEFSDNIFQANVGVEVTPLGYATWGLYSAVGPNCAVISIYDLQGVRQDTNAFCSLQEFIYVGETVSFLYDEVADQFFYSTGLIDSTGKVVGYLMSFDNSLDTNFTKRFDLFDHTYIRGFDSFGDELLLLGDYSINNGFEGSFLLRTDLSGEILSNTLLHPSEPNSNFSNTHIEKQNDRFFIGGLANNSADERYGILTITNSEGVLVEEIEYQSPEYEVWSRLGITKLSNDELMVVQTLGYEEYDNDFNSDLYWRTVRLAKIDPETGVEYWSQTYLDDYEIISGRWMDIEATPDGGVAILGVAYNSPDVFFYNYLLKIDAEGNQEWFQSYWVEEGGFAVNWLRDLEVTEDGGFIMTGTLENYDLDPWSKSWTLKVDACGDTEWQDCQPLSTSLQESLPLKVFPNPSAGQFTVEVPANLSPVSWELLDISGRQVKAGNLDSTTQEFSVDVKLPSGVYMLLVSMKSGIIAKNKIYVE